MAFDVSRKARLIGALKHGDHRLREAHQLVADVHESGDSQHLPEALFVLSTAAASAGRPDVQVKAFHLAATRIRRATDEIPLSLRTQLVELFTATVPLFLEYPDYASSADIDDIFEATAPHWIGGGGEPVDFIRHWVRWAIDTAVFDPESSFERWAADYPGTEDSEKYRSLLIEYFTKYRRYGDAVAACSRREASCFSLPPYEWLCLALAALDEGDAELGTDAFESGLAAIENFGDHVLPDSSLERSVLITGMRFDLLVRGMSISDGIDYLRDVDDSVGGLSDLTTWGSTPLEMLTFQLSLITGLSEGLSQCHGDGDWAIGLEHDPELTITALREQLIESATDLARRFDSRNGNTFYSDSLNAATSPTPLRAQLRFSEERDTKESLPPENPDTGNLSIEEELKFADQCAGVSPEEASRAYAAAARKLTERGLHHEAGHAYAEAAHCLKDVDSEASHSLFTLAVARLMHNSTNSSILIDVIEDWRSVAVTEGFVEEWLDEAVTAMELPWPDADSEMTDAHRDMLGRRRDARTSRLGVRAATTALSALDPTDTHHLSVLQEVLDIADAAARCLADLGFARDAARGFWASGKLSAVLDRMEEAHYAFTSAIEGLTIIGDKTAMVLVAAETISTLQHHGMHAEAEAVAVNLLDPPAPDVIPDTASSGASPSESPEGGHPVSP